MTKVCGDGYTMWDILSALLCTVLDLGVIDYVEESIIDTTVINLLLCVL